MYGALRRMFPPAWANLLIAVWYSALIVLILLTSLYAHQAHFPYGEL